MLLYFKRSFKGSIFLIAFFQVLVWCRRYFQIGLIDQTMYFFSSEYIYKNFLFFFVIWVSSSLISFIKDIK
ncbi:hypothetical protein A4G19_09125 [Pasteurellaceae bacterium Macca]|nr:hypothetical protein [Pasteurellaceae bacterium Macca]